MDEDIALKTLIESGERLIGDLLQTFLSSYNSLLLERGYKRSDLHEAADIFAREFGMGKVTIRKKPEPRAAKPRGRPEGVKEEKKGRGAHTHDELVRKLRAKRGVLTWTPLDQAAAQGVPPALEGGYYCDDKKLGLGDDESLFSMKSRNQYEAIYIINGRMEARYLTTSEAKRFRDMGIIVNDDNVDDKDQEFFDPTI